MLSNTVPHIAVNSGDFFFSFFNVFFKIHVVNVDMRSAARNVDEKSRFQC